MKFKDFIKDALVEANEDYVMQKLADNDINSSIKNGCVYVDKDEIAKTKRILKSIGQNFDVKAM